MKTKIVVWGNDQNEEKILIALELLAKENKVNIYTFPEKIATEELYTSLFNDWRNGKEIEFPEGHTLIQRELSASEDILPEEIKLSQSNIIERVQTEWHFMVLSAKLSEMYHSELEEFKGKVKDLKAFDKIVWDELKEFWSKVQNQVRERNLFREHANSLRNQTNELFESMKGMRKALDEDFKRISKENAGKFSGLLESIEEKITKGLGLQPIFEELKNLQRDFKDTKFTKEDRNAIWNRLDKAFKTVKEKRFGPNSGKGGGNSPMNRLEKRYQGLLGAIQKMQSSIDRDKREIKHQDRKIEQSEGQLEAQIRQAKIKMTDERIRSKELKLADMMKTKGEIEARMKTEEAREKKREEKAKIAERKKEVKQKIAADIESAAKEREADIDKLAKAASAISGGVDAEKTPINAATNFISETLEDVVDTVKAVASVIEDKAEDLIESLTEEE